jgi:TetR/AcrR family transcriptional regulator
MDDREYSEAEEKIFMAALDEFSTHGKKGARMQDIADKAGFNKALVHYYFRSKERLYDDVLSFVLRRYMLRVFEGLDEARDFPAMLHLMITRYIELLDRHQWLPKFVLRELSEGAPVLRKRIKTLGPVLARAAPERFLRQLNASIEAGQVRPVDPVQTLFTVLGACIFFFAGFPIFSALLPAVEKQRKRLVKERADHIYDVVMNGLLPREGRNS